MKGIFPWRLQKESNPFEQGIIWKYLDNPILGPDVMTLLILWVLRPSC